MAGRKLPAAAVPTPGPWLVRGAVDDSASPLELMLGVEPATDERPGGRSYFIRRVQPIERDDGPLHIANGIYRLADARLIAAAPDLTALLLRLLTSPDLTRHDLDPGTCTARDAAWDLLVHVAPHLEIGP